MIGSTAAVESSLCWLYCYVSITVRVRFSSRLKDYDSSALCHIVYESNVNNIMLMQIGLIEVGYTRFKAIHMYC